jgi:hypothetical protein
MYYAIEIDSSLFLSGFFRRSPGILRDFQDEKPSGQFLGSIVMSRLLGEV